MLQDHKRKLLQAMPEAREAKRLSMAGIIRRVAAFNAM